MTTETPIDGVPRAPGTQQADRVPWFRRPAFDRGVVVLASWYTALMVALGLWVLTLPATAPVDEACLGLFCGLSPQKSAVLMIVMLCPTTFVMGLLALVTLSLATKIRSGAAAGTLAAAIGVVGSISLLAR